MTPNAILFRARQAHWQSQGLTGIEILQALATDPELPSFFKAPDIEDIEGIKAVTVVQRRRREIGPPFIKASLNAVLYPVPDYIGWLIARFTQAAAKPPVVKARSFKERMGQRKRNAAPRKRESVAAAE